MSVREPRIEDHGVIGDGRSAALVARDGSVSWLCWPRFDSPALFASILDAERGGRFRVAPTRPLRSFRRYVDRTNVLESWFDARAGTLRVRDAMTIARYDGRAARLDPEHELLRIATCVRGEVDVAVEVDLRPGTGLERAALKPSGAFGLRAEVGRGAVTLRGDLPLEVGPDGVARGRAVLRAGQEVAISLSYDEEGPVAMPPLGRDATERMRETMEIWRSIARGIDYEGPYRDAVMRSALAIKLLVFAPSGAVVAAPTTSLPERVGGDLNWDYRYCWLRDAALTVRALYGLGLHGDAENFASWLLHTTRLTRPRLHVLYDVFGARPGPERTLDWLSGYRGSRPVRAGNLAERQLQLDVYGEVVSAVAQVARRGARLDRETQSLLRGLGDYVAAHWRDPDSGIWEPREPPRQRTFSIAMCWIALDRLLELSRAGAVRRVRVDDYDREMSAMREAIETRGFDRTIGSYVADLGGRHVDAALLLLAWHGYATAGSERMRGTWRAIQERLGLGRGLLYRYEPSRTAGEGAFGACGFWAVEYLARGGGALDEADERMRELVAFANDLGLYAEEIDPASGEQIGNFPQGFTHVGLVSAALAVAERARDEAAGRWNARAEPAEGSEAWP